MKIKDGVLMDGLTDAIVTALPIVEKVLNHHNIMMVVTSGKDDVPGRVEQGHADGRAVDVRAHHINPYLLPVIKKDLEAALGRHYRVVIEIFWYPMQRTHLHIVFKGAPA